MTGIRALRLVCSLRNVDSLAKTLSKLSGLAVSKSVQGVMKVGKSHSQTYMSEGVSRPHESRNVFQGKANTGRADDAD